MIIIQLDDTFVIQLQSLIAIAPLPRLSPDFSLSPLIIELFLVIHENLVLSINLSDEILKFVDSRFE